MNLSDEIVSRAEDFSTLKEFFMSDPAIELQIRRCFAKFLKGYRFEGEFVYKRQILDICSHNRNSLVVSYLHLGNRSPTLAIWLADCPAVVLNNFNLSARTIAEELLHADGWVVPAEHIFVRIDGLPIRDVVADVLSNRNEYQEGCYMDKLVKVGGKVNSSTLVSPHARKVIIEEVHNNWFTEGSLIEVVMRNDLVTQAPLGHIIEVTGILQTPNTETRNHLSLTSSVYVEANHISPSEFLWGEENPGADYNYVVINRVMHFLKHFEVEAVSGKRFSYDKKLRECLDKLVWQLDIDFDHLNQHDPELCQASLSWNHPDRYFDLMELAVNLYFESEVLPRIEKMMTPIEVKFRVSRSLHVEQYLSSRFSVKHENSHSVVEQPETETFFGLCLDAVGQIQREPLQKMLCESRKRKALDIEVNRVLEQMDDDNRNRLMHTMNMISKSKPQISRHQCMLEARSLIRRSDGRRNRSSRRAARATRRGIGKVFSPTATS